ncbi:DUF559 domain-containing protein [Brooklawnia cerclae]|uniref:Very-short-patch-repair endonuclease n=1 Tax=Brooklawnia cerclae TaxID=349934 RepID=A0ABX0SDD0_9ACTN|nr:very-short-patch-repair endonuclease [Brooklawnia cerclae]
MDEELWHRLREEGVLVRRKAGRLRASLDHAASAGLLKSVLPGVMVAAETDITWQVRALAACAYADDAVITGEAAAALGYWHRCMVHEVTAFHRNAVGSGNAVRWHRRAVPPEWIVRRGTLRFAHPAYAAVDLAGSGASSAIDEALRSGCQLTQLWEAFAAMPGRRGNSERRALLLDSRDEPWSEAERLAHRILRRANLEGWQTNVRVGDYFLDIAWKRKRVCLEVDGFEYHGGRAGFEADRLRDQVLASLGWVVVRVTWAQLQSDPEGFLRRLRGVLRKRRRPMAA